MAGVVDRVDYWGGATGQNCSGKNAVGQVTVMYLSFPQNISSSIMFCCTYDHRGRQTSESVCYADSTLAQMYLLYDNLGRVGQCFVGIGDDNHVESYAYNLHGNLSALSGDGYTQRLFYEISPSGAPTHKRFDGKISSISWNELESRPDTLTVLSYDGRGRFRDATTVSNPYDLSVETITYQDNGKTLILNRYSSDGNMCEDLLFSTLGEMKTPLVTNYMEAGEDYSFEYDERSNLTLDELTGFSAAYTLLDRPSRIEPFFGGPVYFTWLADGTKVAQLGDYDEGYDYIGSFRYRRGDDTLRLESIPFSKGRIRFDSGGNILPEYHATDYLGSIRRVMSETGVDKTYDYVPYGSLVDEFTNTPHGNEYLFQGKEMIVFEGFSLYDFGARFYNPRTLMWLTRDPLAEERPDLSPYVFCAADPVNMVDPDGRMIVVLSGNKEFSYEYGFFYDPEGRVYSGEELGFQAIESALNQIMSRNNGFDLVDALIRSEKMVLISYGGNRNRETGKYLHFDSAVSWNPDNDAVGGQPSFISLAHELAHSKDRLGGTINMETWYSFYDERINAIRDVPKAEIFSTHIENLIRKEHNIPLRVSYSIYENGDPHEGFIIYKGKSLYFDTTGNHSNNYRIINKNNRYVY